MFYAIKPWFLTSALSEPVVEASRMLSGKKERCGKERVRSGVEKKIMETGVPSIIGRAPRTVPRGVGYPARLAS